MAIFYGSRALEAVLIPPSRSILILSCFRAYRRYESSWPVRYIPEDKRTKKTQHLQHPEIFSEKEVKYVSRSGISKSGKGTRELLNFDKDEFRDGYFDAEIVNTSDIFEQFEEFSEFTDAIGPALGFIDTNGRNNSGSFLDEAPNSHGNNVLDSIEKLDRNVKEDAEKLAIELLATRAFTTVELQKKLRGKKYPLHVVETVISDLKCRGLLNDGLYAETFSRSRWLSLTWGPKRIKHALIQRGVSVKEADTATKQVFEEDYDVSMHGMSRESMERLFLQASKQWVRGGESSPEKRKARIVRWLQYRGFSWVVTSYILKKLESHH